MGSPCRPSICTTMIYVWPSVGCLATLRSKNWGVSIVLASKHILCCYCTCNCGYFDRLGTFGMSRKSFWTFAIVQTFPCGLLGYIEWVHIQRVLKLLKDPSITLLYKYATQVNKPPKRYCWDGEIRSDAIDSWEEYKVRVMYMSLDVRSYIFVFFTFLISKAIAQPW